MKRARVLGWVIRLSNPPAIPTYYAVDRSATYYATSNIHDALIYLRREDAERINRNRALGGIIESGPSQV